MLKSLILEPGSIEQLSDQEALIIAKFPGLACCNFEEICGDLDTPDEGGCKKGCICGVIQ
jgi:hypothetical protein